MKLNKLSFGFNAVNAGQKSSTLNAEPTLTVNSTEGKFSVTAAVSAALGVAVGENIQFLSNVDNIMSAIQEQNPMIVGWADNNGVDLNTPEGVEKALTTFVQFAIAKGHPYLTKTGEPVMVAVRLTKEEKNKFANEHAEEIIKDNREALKAAAREAGETDIENDEVLAKYVTEKMIDFPKVAAFAGSKTSTTSSATGIGLPLNFTDSNIWHQMKKDLGDEATKVNRIYDVILKKTTVGEGDDAEVIEPIKATVNDGQKTVEITAYPLIFKEDVKPIQRGSLAKTQAE